MRAMRPTSALSDVAALRLTCPSSTTFNYQFSAKISVGKMFPITAMCAQANMNAPWLMQQQHRKCLFTLFTFFYPAGSWAAHCSMNAVAHC